MLEKPARDRGDGEAVEPGEIDHLLGLFEPSHMQFEADRERDPAGEPSLAEMTKTALDIQDLILMMARDNPRWGYTRIRGALYNLGHEIGRNTVKRILLENGFAPTRKGGCRGIRS